MKLYKTLYWILFLACCSYPVAAAEHWLELMTKASKNLNYRGAFLYARGDNIQIMKVHQVVVDGERIEKIWPVNGQPMEIMRRGNELTCIHPLDSDASLEHAIPAGPFSQIFKQQLTNANQVYRIQQVAEDRIAERKTDLLMLMPENSDRFSYRLWIDQETGLLLRSEIIALNMEVLEQFQFVDFELIADAEANQPVFSESDKRHVESLLTSSQAVQRHIRQKYEPGVPDFYHMMGFSESDDGMGMMSFSDGLSSFSLFWEPAEMKMPEASYQQGATHIISVKKGRKIITLIGEIPEVTARQILQNIEL